MQNKHQRFIIGLLYAVCHIKAQLFAIAVSWFRAPLHGLEPKVTTGCSSIVATAISIIDTREMPPEVIRFIWSIRSCVIILGHFPKMLREFFDDEAVWKVLGQFPSRLNV